MELLKPVFTVHELNEYVDLMLGHDPNLKNLTVEGELSGCKRHTSGHLYFSLKDDTASVSCVMWKQSVLTGCKSMSGLFWQRRNWRLSKSKKV